jgi:hypothetical protein
MKGTVSRYVERVHLAIHFITKERRRHVFLRSLEQFFKKADETPSVSTEKPPTSTFAPESPTRSLSQSLA